MRSADAAHVLRYEDKEKPTGRDMKKKGRGGFTLIELSIVLVVIGLLVGGVLAGQHLISAAAVRAQITQIEKYNTAANTFREKTGYLPGDIPAGPATMFGFAARGAYAGEGDGNGLLEGVEYDAPAENSGIYEATGETVVFWRDLSSAQMIDQTFNTASELFTPGSDLGSSSTWNKYYPQAKIGRGNYIYVFSINGANWFDLSVITYVYVAGGMISKPGLSVGEAYAIDNKIDDGIPTSGNVNASYLAYGALMSSPASGTDSPTTCYNSTTHTYSVSQNNGAGINCALRFKMQAGD
jgi:prepilin-type N-terminal cleavage/methylation domain-containing protein